jgi:hypothetical protein
MKDMFANGNSFSGSMGDGLDVMDTLHRPVPTWKFGISPDSLNSDRGYM